MKAAINKQKEKCELERAFEQKNPENVFCAHLESTEKGWASSATVQVYLHALMYQLFLVPWEVSGPLGSQGWLSLCSQIALAIRSFPPFFKVL